jgi:hypothetical protein
MCFGTAVYMSGTIDPELDELNLFERVTELRHHEWEAYAVGEQSTKAPPIAESHDIMDTPFLTIAIPRFVSTMNAPKANGGVSPAGDNLFPASINSNIRNASGMIANPSETMQFEIPKKNAILVRAYGETISMRFPRYAHRSVWR